MTQRARVSPVLGYNHNLRHGGRVFHVQTEDSGQGYARAAHAPFLRGDDPLDEEAGIRPEHSRGLGAPLMQQLHKSMIKELTHGEHDARIGAFFIARGEPARLDAPAAPAAVAVEKAQEQPELPAAPAPPPAAPRTPAPIIATAAATPAPAPKPVVMVKPGGVRRPPVVLSSSADGVVVRRNVVINVGGGGPPVNGTPGASQPPATGTTADPRRARRRPSPPATASSFRPRAPRARRPRRRPNPHLSRWRRRATSACRGRRPVRRARSSRSSLLWRRAPRRPSSHEVKMPWDPPGGKPACERLVRG